MKRLSEEYRDFEIKVMGRVEHEKILEIRKKTWALIFPSISEEPLPYALVEAMALGTTPIASEISGVPEIIRETPTEKYLLKPGSVYTLVNKIKLLSSWSRKEVLVTGIELRKHIYELFNEEKLTKKLFSLFA